MKYVLLAVMMAGRSVTGSYAAAAVNRQVEQNLERQEDAAAADYARGVALPQPLRRPCLCLGAIAFLRAKLGNLLAIPNC